MCNTHYQQWRSATPPAERRRPTPVERFWSKVDQRSPDECWPWTDVPNSVGYGVFHLDGRRVGAHRIAFMLANDLPLDTVNTVDHTCHNQSGCAGGPRCPHRLCCNPAHLENTTSGLNTLRGESPSAKHARKTHCVNGHEFTPENTYVYVWRRTQRPRRMCRQCMHDRDLAKRQQKESA